MRAVRFVALVVVLGLWSCGGGGSSGSDVAVDSAGDAQPADVSDQDILPDQAADVDDVAPLDVKDTKDNLDQADEDADLVDDTQPEVDVDPCPGGCDDGDPCTTDKCLALGCSHAPIAGCCEGQQPFAVDFEAEESMTGWEVESSVPGYTDDPNLESYVWQRFDGRAHVSAWALYFGNPVTKNYDNGHRVAATATSPEFQLAPDARYTLRFWAYLGVEDGRFSDFLSVNAVVGGSTIRLWAKGEDDTVTKWIQLSVDLSAFAGKSIRLQFAFDSVNERENGMEGVYVDSITVDRTCGADLSCSTPAACNDMLPCTMDSCDQGKCKFIYLEDCCMTPSECEDWDGCTINKCTNNVCSTTPDPDPQCCNESSTCKDDDDVCTVDVCRNTRCEFLPSGAAGCCVIDTDCDDNNSCTIDSCTDNTCFYVSMCCTEDSDCNDFDDICTNDVCEFGSCKYYNTGQLGCCNSIIVDEDFEDGAAQGFYLEATNSDILKWIVGVGDAYQGNRSMFISTEDITTSMSAEAVLPIAQIPPVGGKLTFYMKQNMATSGECSKNRLVVKFGATVLATECNTVANWYKVSVPLTPVAGQQGELAIAFYASPSSLSSYQVWVDKVVLEQQCCNMDNDCDDGNPCTTDSCPGVSSICQFVPIPDCCLSDDACNDDDNCTVDRCVNNWCEHINECCAADAECDDNDAICTSDWCINSRCYFEPTGVAGCCDPDLYFQSFEAGLSGWVPSDTTAASHWRISNVDMSSGLQSLYFGNDSSSGYTNNVESSIVSPSLTLPMAPSVKLNFNTKYNTEYADKFKVQLETANGVRHLVAELSGSQNSWASKSYDIKSFAGQNVRIVFSFRSDGSVTQLGVFVDDLSVVADCCTETAQCDDGNPCTQDLCPGQQAYCVNKPVEGCCVNSNGCADGNPCTVDVCTDDHQCEHTDVCCDSDLDCNDGDDVCTQDLCIDSFCFFKPTAEPGCCSPVLFGENFDQGQLSSRWVAQNPGTGDTWKLGTVNAVSAPNSLYFGNTTESSYSSSVDATITLSEAVQLPNEDNLMLTLKAKSATEANYDKLAVNVVVDGAVTKLGEITGQSTGFVDKSYPLAAFKGKAVQLRFTFKSDGSGTSQGVWIDDIVILRQCCNLDSDCNDGSVCTADSCPGPVSNCIFEPIPGCCQLNSDCDDGNVCTVDSCLPDNTCANVNECCETDAECSDGDDLCTTDLCVGGKCKFVPTGAPGCCMPNLFYDGFESASLEGYLVVNDSDSSATWHVSGIGPFKGGKALVFSDDAESSYGSNVDASLETPKVLIPANAITPMLSFGLKYKTESCCDRLTVFVVDGETANKVGEYKGEGSNWTEIAVVMDAYKGKTVSVRFEFHSDSGISYWGVKIDELAITQQCCSNSEQCADDDPCTFDYCPGANSACINEPITGCCVVSSDCIDEDPCTNDICGKDYFCKHINVCCTESAQCDDDDDVCTVDSCVDGLCLFAPTGAEGCCSPPLFADTFATDKGWTYEGQWARGQATASTCSVSPLGHDPASDHTSTADNSLAGVALGGCASKTDINTWFYLTSPKVDASGDGDLYVSFWRWLNSDSFLYMDNRVEVWDGAAWVKVWSQPSQSIVEQKWNYFEFNVSPYANAEFQVRFGVNVLSAAGKDAASWNIDDVRVFRSTSNICCTLDTDCDGQGAVCLGGTCVDKCLAGCMGKQCGPDPCGGSCGTCAEGSVCLEAGSCCELQCQDKECGPDGCGGSCGSCGTNEMCHDGNCYCVEFSTQCGDICCAPGFSCLEGACCDPQCGTKECGADACGGACGFCSDLEHCIVGMCECNWDTLPLAGEFFKVNTMLFVDHTQPGVGFDVDMNPETCSPEPGCSGGIDNSVASLIKNAPQIDLNLLFATLLEEGYLAPLVAFNITPAGPEATIYGGEPEAPLSVCDHLQSDCPHWVLGESFDSQTCVAGPTWPHMVLTPPLNFFGGELTTVANMPMRLPGEARFTLTIYAAQVDASWTNTSEGGMVTGWLGGAVRKADIVAMADVLPLLPGMSPSKSLFVAMLDAYLVPDLDLDQDGEKESCSLAIEITAIPTELLGVLAP